MKRAWLDAALALALPACSIKESRTHCPVRLSVLTESARHLEADTKLAYTLTVHSPENGEVAQGTEDAACPGKVDFSVPRGLYEILALCAGASARREATDTLRFVQRQEMDSIYACRHLVDCQAERTADTLRMDKQFATLTMQLHGGSRIPGAAFEVESEGVGLDMHTLEPLPGTRTLAARPLGGDLFQLRIPRQREEGQFRIHLFAQNPVSGERVCLLTLHLSPLLSHAGYDWQQPALEDIFLEIDQLNDRAEVHVEGWAIQPETPIDF